MPLRPESLRITPGTPTDPSLHLPDYALRRRQFGFQERGETAIPVSVRQPGGNAKRVVLVSRSPLLGEAAAPQRRIDLGNCRTPGRDFPAVERPEVDAGPEPLADKAQPGNPGMGGFRDRPLHIEMENGFSATGAFLGQPPPASIAHARRAIARRALADKINVGVILVGRPMALEIVEEGGPIVLQSMHLEVAQRKRKAVVDADQRGQVLGQLVDQPFGNPTPRPVFLQRWRRQNLDRWCIALGQIDAQALQTRGRRLRA